MSPADPAPRRPVLPAPAWLVRAATVAGLSAVVGAAAWLLGQLVSALTLLVVSLAVGALVAGVLAPAVDRAAARRVPRWVSALTGVLVLVVVGGALGWLVGERVADQVPELRDSLGQAVERLPAPLQQGIPNELTPGAATGSAAGGGEDAAPAPAEALSAVAGAFEVLVAVFLTLAFAFLFLKDGPRMWRWVLHRVRPGTRERVRAAGDAAWGTVGSYVRGLTVVALFDAVGIGLGLLVLGVPLVMTLAVLQFVLSYVPTIGALVAGAVAVAVALVDGGLTTAALTLLLVVVVQQVGNDVVEPWVLGRRLRLHPAVVLGAVTAGGLLWGIAGALLFVPLTAAAAAAVRAVGAQGPATDESGPS